MSWSKEIKESGILKVDGKFVKIYTSSTSYKQINIGEPVGDARWVGESLVVYMTDGKIRKYSDQSSYSLIR